jgi:hypothetical protein
MTHFGTIASLFQPIRGILLGTLMAAGLANQAFASFIVFEAAGATPASITPTRDAFRAAVGGGTVAGANGDFGGIRREINWDGVPDLFSDPTPLPSDFFNSNSPRGLVYSTPGTGFLVSRNTGSTLFGFQSDLQTFSPTRLFAAVNSNIVDINFLVPGTSTAATTSAFGLVFVDVETPNLTKIDFFDANDVLLFSRFALAGDNQGLSFVGAVADAGERISRVRATSGGNALISNGVRASEDVDFVVMDDFLYATPTATPEPASLCLFGIGFLACALVRKRLRH